MYREFGSKEALFEACLAHYERMVLDHVEDDVVIAEVLGVDEIGLVQRIMDGFAARLCIGPLTEFLCPPAVIGIGALTIGQPLAIHQPLHALIHSLGIHAPLGIHFSHRPSLHRGFGMQRKMNQLHIDVVGLFELFNTHGTEITPRSNVVREDLKRYGLGHGQYSFLGEIHCPTNNAMGVFGSQQRG